MNPKKPKEEKSRNAGISLEPDLIRKAKALAEKRGLKSISTLARSLFTSIIQEAESAGEILEAASKSNLDKAKKAVTYGGRKPRKKPTK